MAEFLTQEWLDEFRRLGAELPERQGATARIQPGVVAFAAAQARRYLAFPPARGGLRPATHDRNLTGESHDSTR